MTVPIAYDHERTICQQQMKNRDDACLGGRRDTLNRRGLCCVQPSTPRLRCTTFISWYYLVHFLLHLGIRCRRDLNAFVVACFLGSCRINDSNGCGRGLEFRLEVYCGQKSICCNRTDFRICYRVFAIDFALLSSFCNRVFEIKFLQSSFCKLSHGFLQSSFCKLEFLQSSSFCKLSFCNQLS